MSPPKYDAFYICSVKKQYMCQCARCEFRTGLSEPGHEHVVRLACTGALQSQKTTFHSCARGPMLSEPCGLQFTDAGVVGCWRQRLLDSALLANPVKPRWLHPDSSNLLQVDLAVEKRSRHTPNQRPPLIIHWQQRIAGFHC